MRSCYPPTRSSQTSFSLLFVWVINKIGTMTNQEYIESIRLKGEQWKDVIGFEGRYMVSSLGRVASLSFPIEAGQLHYARKQHLLTLTIQNNGYVATALSYAKNKVKTVKVHRLVAEAFIPNPHNFPTVNHKDENKTNNTLNNLEWCTHHYNVNYGTGIQRRRTKFVLNKSNCKPVAKLDINKNVIQQYDGLIYASNDINRDYSAITFAINHGGKCAGFYWKFL